MYIDGINLSEESKKKFGFFIKIEEIQIAIFLLLCKQIMPCSFFDIGSNIGFYSLILKKYFPQIKVLAFEPTPETFRELQVNYSINPTLADGFLLHNLAISSSIGAIDFMDFGDMSGRNGIANTQIHGRTGSAKIITINTTSLDELNYDVFGSCLLKIDTEGHEAQVLLGGRNFFSNNSCVVQIEDGHGKSDGVINDIFKSYGYSQILKAGPDYYYTNVSILQDPQVMLNLLEDSINFLIDHRWNKSPSL